MTQATICHIASLLNRERAAAEDALLKAVEENGSTNVQTVCEEYARVCKFVNDFKVFCGREARS